MKILLIIVLIFLSFLNNIRAQSVLNAKILTQSDLTEAVVYSQLPRNLQFYARDNNDSANVTFAGKLNTIGFDSVYVEVYKNNLLWKRNSAKLNYNGDSAPFNLSQKIHSELSEYKFLLYVKEAANINSVLLKSADSIVCGDAYIISGQSNSHNTNDTAVYKNEFCRSFGVQTPNGNADTYNPADTNWGLSKAVSFEGNPWTGPCNVGVWGLYLQKQITDSTGIPTCIINGGRRGTTIESHLRNNSNPEDLTSNYGKLLYRVNKSGLSGNIKAIFWYQGESNGDASWMNYESNFNNLYYSWKENYPGIQKVFLFQVRQGCNGNLNGGFLREVQRQLTNKYQDIEMISTMGIQSHGFDHCHYGFYGYLEISVNVYKQTAKLFYNSNNTNINPPNI
ncbi:MAG TPA: sialate O-acetylesterase, partial [Ignavibacteria bacterium]|nr:sialate O-acetylesterase [Ignavibacteria bacterium]